ncbi:hypothetical protein CUS_6571 [Ruminococcus albus 8]|uniref:Uncharacterized protein n=1 Tax=Ruminococcus albus 8 TaxID=246199 RepID=E9SB98_RUMAL|nr:hypothetical protein CUS_6571 [Ruminococcus albus 8]
MREFEGRALNRGSRKQGDKQNKLGEQSESPQAAVNNGVAV